jgi:L-amino acid N-acyltransferase YncA
LSSSENRLKIRFGTVQDAELVAELLNQIIADRDGTALTQPVMVSEEANYLAAILDGGCLLLAERESVLLGFQSVQRRAPEVGEIGTFIARTARGQGVGRKLLNEMLRWAEAQGIRTLVAQVAAGNGRGQRAYRAWGFEEVSATPGQVRLELSLLRPSGPAAPP